MDVQMQNAQAQFMAENSIRQVKDNDAIFKYNEVGTARGHHALCILRHSSQDRNVVTCGDRRRFG